MSIERCDRHGHWDSDKHEGCPRCDTVGGLTEPQWIKEFGNTPGFCNPFDDSDDN